MSELLREAWLTVEPGDYEKHMAGIGQAQANAGLMAAWMAAGAGPGALLVAGAGTGWGGVRGASMRAFFFFAWGRGAAPARLPAPPTRLVDAVLVADDLPELGADLVAALAGL